MAKVAIVTDSTIYFPPQAVNGNEIHSLPLQVIWDDHIYLDGIDIQPEVFYTRLQNSKTMPSTSQATPHSFRETYAKLLDKGYEILSIHISSKLSGTLDSAMQAKNEFPGSKIELFDSKSTSMALGFQVLAAAKAAENGASMTECLSKAEFARKNTGVLFVVDTLEFLHRGGRIGGAAAFIGNAFNLKPILGLQDGKIEAIDKVRTKNKAVTKLIDILEKQAEGHSSLRVCAIHANASAEADSLLEQIKNRFGKEFISETLKAEVSPVIGTHTGPGTVGVAYATDF